MKRIIAEIAPPCFLFLLVLVVCAADASAVLIGHWPLDGDGNAVVGDSGALINGPTAAADRFGNPTGALSINGGAQQRVEIPNGGGLANLQQGTISMFVQWNGIQDSACCGPSSGNVTGRQGNGVFSNQILGLNSNDPNVAGVTWQAYNAGAPIMTGGTAVGSGVWRHVAVTYQSGSHTLYLDGQIDATSSVADTIRSETNVPFTIGAWIGDGAGYSTSIVDDVKVFDTVLSQAEIQALNVVIPEPSTLILAVFGAMLLYAGQRRRRPIRGSAS